jgi:2-iminobutanoate/2-iminopropanoate deaminase
VGHPSIVGPGPIAWAITGARGSDVQLTALGHPEVPATTDLSQLVKAGPFVFLSGQIGIGPDGRLVSSLVEEQISQAFRNVDKLLASVGSSLASVIRITSYLTNESHMPALQRIRREFFSPPFPASTLLIVQQLASRQYLYEVDVIAVGDGASRVESPTA